MSQQSQPGDDTDTLVALHKLYVEMANAVSQRRDSANKFFVTVSTLPAAFLMLAYRTYQDTFSNPEVMIVSGAIGLAVTIVWMLHLKTYHKLNQAKFEVILDIEKRLPHAGFTNEWEILKRNKYQGLSDAELWLTRIIATVYLVLIGFAIVVAIL